MINFCIFEDSYYKKLFPITETRLACSTLVGISSIFEKIQSYYDHGNITLHCRDYIKPTLAKKYPNNGINNINTGAPCFFINGRLIMDNNIANTFAQIKGKNNYLFTYNNQVVSAFVRGDLLQEMSLLLKDIPTPSDMIQILRNKCICKELDNVNMLTNIWDLVTLNPQIIKNDFKNKNQYGIIKGNIKPFTIIYNENNVFINTESTIEDFVLIDATKGPVFIDKNVYIQSNARIEGPAYIGSHSKILGGKLSNSSIGTHCKVSGEISNCIFQGYSNKSHDGFLGHSYVGQWVNLGANTITSNLKNNYSNIKIINNHQLHDTQEQFLGTFFGDHVKTSINTAINTGTIIHFASTLTDKEINEKEILPFTWGSAKTNEKQNFEKFIRSTKKIMMRRNIDLTQNEIELFKYLYTLYTYEKVNV